ncbi:acyl-protein synthase [Pseudomonas fluorescens]|uniref:Putative Acyl-protein synthetase n=1 Tax=Pseudomonas fluorescens (strain Pf0-1) TaxID=205922 RepID=Q3KD55_PSEPF|nr:acyl-protein synthase [Pseudomonas fluorescens]ABA74300.1 putative Acyl-protein synthetase [Pseudomonas fluorescens Pf0-1]MBY9025923.1 acyl-protein synthase [Pseudomonas fluorescens]MBY9031270.1 acyl-protein synthase [Pseudomonas fluorescens]MBY9037741.1 acyl-protein synthase [Pseudomonas fluorescens]MBY9041335.1 acyl-protein synthase [Pseudomonas fluorescens]
MSHFPHSDALCALTQPYCPDSVPDGLFDQAMAEISQFHSRHTPGYEHWLNANGLSVNDLDSLDDWSRLPPIFASFFKQQQLLSPAGIDARELTSSGTSGQKSRMRYDERSLGAARNMVAQIFQHYDWNTPNTPCNYLLLGYEPEGCISLGTSFTDQFLCQFAPVNRVAYALRRTGGGHEFDGFGVIAALQSFAEEGLPVRIFGFPAFLWQTLQRMQATGVADLQLAEGSLTLFGGGWKTHAAQEIPRQQLYERIHRQLGIKMSRCRDGYGAVEHAVPYLECAHHHFHVPVYSKVFVRHPADFTVQPYGRQGLLSFVSPYISSSPAHAVVMSDLATLHPGVSCGCGLSTDWFELHGRAATTAGRSCAMAASELLEKH